MPAVLAERSAKPSRRHSLLRPQKLSLAQVLKCNLDALIIEFLVVGTKLVAAAGGAVEELDHFADGGVWFPFELGRAADVDGAIQIQVVDVVKELAHQQPWHRLVANAQHLGT